MIEPTPLAVELIVTPLAALQPLPSFFSMKTVKVCGLPTGFVPLWPIVIRASTHVFEAFALLPACWSPVSRCKDTVLTTTSVEAFTDVAPMVGDVIFTVHEPVVPTVAQVEGPLNAPGPPVIEKEIVVPAGAFANARAAVHVHVPGRAVW